MNLFINVGNTNTIFSFDLENNIKNLKYFKISTKEIINNNFDILFKSLLDQNKINHPIKNVYISSVVSVLNDKLEKYFNNEKIQCNFINFKNIPTLDLSSLYNSYELGQDILAQICYIANFFEEAIVFSVGTNSVIYHIDKWKLSGCIILPGIQQSINTIINSSDISNINIVNTEKLFGSNTSEAISIGLINVLENEIKYIIKKTKKDIPVICTGGNMNFFKKNKWWFIENLEILGLYIYKDMLRNKKKGK